MSTEGEIVRRLMGRIPSLDKATAKNVAKEVVRAERRRDQRARTGADWIPGSGCGMVQLHDDSAPDGADERSK